jgi:RecA-family ATPase
MLTRIDLARYDSEPIPERAWGVRDRFPRRNVTLLSGEGGIGKSILLLQLGAAHALGRAWLGSMPEQGPVVVVNCEDEDGELVRRLEPILKNYGASFSDIDRDMHVFSLANDDPLLAVFAPNARRMVPTPLYKTLMEEVREVQPVCIIIDNVADVFGGNEIDRAQVRQFVGLMRQLALASGGYVIMSSHPSLSGIADRRGLSGSTQWHNSVRARAYLHTKREKTASGDEEDTDTRVLEFMKSNYSALSEKIELQWHNGLFLPATPPTASEQEARNAKVDALFLQLLDKATAKGDNVSAKHNANNYASTVFAKEPEATMTKRSPWKTTGRRRGGRATSSARTPEGRRRPRRTICSMGARTKKAGTTRLR